MAAISIAVFSSDKQLSIIKTNNMKTADFTTSFEVGQSPEEVFNAIINPRAWWSEEIEGGTAQLNDVFDYHYKDVHITKIKLTEVIPNKKVVWTVLENDFNFTKDKSEWVGTKVIFEISEEGDKTRLNFTHAGLVPAYECYEICRDAWTSYIQTSLRNLVTTGKGEPNPKEGGFNEDLLQKHKQANQNNHQDYHVSIIVDATPHEAFESINNVTKWWTENLEGTSHKMGDEFTVQFGDVHYSRQKLVEVVPDKKVVWLITESKLNFLQDKQEWNGTIISFDITTEGGKTKVTFTHIGLVPQIECYNDCSNAWGGYIQGSLKQLIDTGKGRPEKKV